MITLSGFHLHAEVGGHDDMVSHAQGLHQDLHQDLAQDLAQDLDHEADHVDVSVFEPARGFAQAETYVPCLTEPELAADPVADICWSRDAPILVPRRYSRLRLPVRAPPISA